MRVAGGLAGAGLVSGTASFSGVLIGNAVNAEVRGDEYLGGSGVLEKSLDMYAPARRTLLGSRLFLGGGAATLGVLEAGSPLLYQSAASYCSIEGSCYERLNNGIEFLDSFSDVLGGPSSRTPVSSNSGIHAGAVGNSVNIFNWMTEQSINTEDVNTD